MIIGKQRLANLTSKVFVFYVGQIKGMKGTMKSYGSRLFKKWMKEIGPYVQKFKDRGKEELAKQKVSWIY